MLKIQGQEERDPRINHSLFSIKNFLVYFVMVCFVVTCSFFVFFSAIDLPTTDIAKSAKLTFLNIFILSLFVSMIENFRRKFTVERPVRRILQETKRITEGDFTARIEPFHGYDSMDEFDVIIEDFNKMAEELSGIETLRTDFIANVSHELKTPLTVIQNYAVMLQNTSLSDELQIEYAKNIVKASKRLTDLITNILKLNKLENQQIYPETTVYNLGEQLCECMLGFEEAWEAKELELDVELEEDLYIKADAELMTLVWNNLFSNAVKFTEPGGKIGIGLKKEEDRVIVQVSDTGCGIAPEVGQHIFEKFYQGDTSHAAQGNGLGLALVKRVIDITGGEISVQSKLGEGTIFKVVLKAEV